MLPKNVIHHIEKKYGKPIRYASDCDAIAGEISSQTKKFVSVNTVKRLLGYISEEREPRLYTLDIIAEYLGCENWDVYWMQMCKRRGSNFGRIDSINISNLKIEDIIEFQYLPDRKVTIKYCGNFFFDVTDAQNSSLLIGDKIEVKQIITNYPMFIDDVIRNEEHLGQLTVGLPDGIKIVE